MQLSFVGIHDMVDFLAKVTLIFVEFFLSKISKYNFRFKNEIWYFIMIRYLYMQNDYKSS